VLFVSLVLLHFLAAKPCVDHGAVEPASGTLPAKAGLTGKVKKCSEGAASNERRGYPIRGEIGYGSAG
jgi:hypothetical protein